MVPKTSGGNREDASFVSLNFQLEDGLFVHSYLLVNEPTKLFDCIFVDISLNRRSCISWRLESLPRGRLYSHLQLESLLSPSEGFLFVLEEIELETKNESITVRVVPFAKISLRNGLLHENQQGNVSGTGNPVERGASMFWFKESNRRVVCWFRVTLSHWISWLTGLTWTSAALMCPISKSSTQVRLCRSEEFSPDPYHNSVNHYPRSFNY